MATSLQRLIVLVIILDIFLGMILMFSFSVGNEHTEREIEALVNNYNNLTYEFKEDFPNPTIDEDKSYVTSEFGDLKAGGSSIFKLFKNGLGYQDVDDCYGEDCSNTFINMLMLIAKIFFIGIHLLLVFESFLIFYTKKNS